MAIVITVCIGAALLLSRWVTLIATGRPRFTSTRGLNINIAMWLYCVLSQFYVRWSQPPWGRSLFVGLLAPHIAAMVGARLVREQIITYRF
ncbi:iron chelate uptake ABC transporter family permease subunit [Vibrio chagasii]|nr:iron chelate uptake ABC transporter family permease subunit [Vibrio chagasii]